MTKPKRERKSRYSPEIMAYFKDIADQVREIRAAATQPKPSPDRGTSNETV